MCICICIYSYSVCKLSVYMNRDVYNHKTYDYCEVGQGNVCTCMHTHIYMYTQDK